MNSNKIRELTDDEVYIFIVLETSQNVDSLFKKLKESNGGWVLAAIEKRFNVQNVEVDKKVMIAVFSIADGVVGKAAKYVDDIVEWGIEKNHSKIDWNRFTHEVYPMGIPIL